MDALSAALRAALADGITVVTPNKRLARRIVQLFDMAQRASGRRAWPAARVQPWNAWLQTLWLDAQNVDAIPNPPQLLTAHQSTYLWRRLVMAETARAEPLIDPHGATELAIDAWRIVNAWGASDSAWRRWSTATASDDVLLFNRWAEHYAATLAQQHAIDMAQAADALARGASGVPAWRNHKVVLAGFVETTSQQDRLMAALRRAGAILTGCDTLPDEQRHVQRASAATAADELSLALSWARGHILANPMAGVAIAIEDLARRRAEVIALAEDVLCPALQWPGQEQRPRPYNVSYGEALADVPIVATAIDLIALQHGPLPVARAAALVRSPYIAGANTQWMARAAIECEWLDNGQREVSFDDLIADLASIDGVLAQRWRAARQARRLPARVSPREWAQAWQTWLGLCGWPGDRTLTSAEFQARRAGEEMLADFASLHAVEARMSRGDALQALSSLAAKTLFQPEVPTAPVQILGLLEAAGQPFEALWVAGLAAERWPAPPQPHPLLPIDWQRERNVPHATAARELAFARAITGQFVRAAPSVVMSHAVREDEHERAPSALIASLPQWDGGECVISTARALFDSAPLREWIVDDHAPAIPAGSRVRGGAGVLDAQSDCPFKAVARYRLDAQGGPVASEGLSARERGILIHHALAAFWRDVRDHATLTALPPDALAARIDAAVATAIAHALRVSRWRCLPPVVVAGEARRVAEVVRRVIEDFDRERPPFRVRDVELETSVTLSGFALRLFLDRVDALDDGGVAIVDYKGGRAVPARFWFDERPQGPQLAVYAAAIAACEPATVVRAAAYMQLKTGEMKLYGVAADAAAWPRLMTPSALKIDGVSDWSAVQARWTNGLNGLAAEIAAGFAAVSPRSDIVCRTCGLQALCRVDAEIVDENPGNAP